MKVLVKLFVLIIAISSVQANITAFKEFKHLHKKVYSSLTHEASSFLNFVKSHQVITAHNKKYELGIVPFELGHNEFSDMSDSDFNKMKGRSPSPSDSTTLNVTSIKDTIVARAAVPSTVDWRPYCNPIQNQGDCGSCWAFSGVAAIETRYHIVKNITDSSKKFKLSEQQIIDCGSPYGGTGCKGGLGIFVFKEVLDTGIVRSSLYPYENNQNNFCKLNTDSGRLYTKGYGSMMKTGNEIELKQLVSLGPVSVGIQANLPTLRYLKSGVYTDGRCGMDIDHEVLVVGYGTENGMDYWLIRNSWGTTWAENGYFKLRRNYNNLCGVALDPTYPTF